MADYILLERKLFAVMASKAKAWKYYNGHAADSGSR